MISVILIYQQNLMREAIRGLLLQESNISVLGDVRDVDEATDIARNKCPDVIILDAHIKGIGGLESVRRLQRINKNIKILVLDHFVISPYAYRYFNLGVQGYLLSLNPQDQLKAALQTIKKGARFIHADVAQAVAIRSFDESKATMFDCLSNRELQIALMIVRGEAVEEIARLLFLGSKTVHSHRYRIFSKLNIENDVQLLHLAVKNGYLDLGLDLLEQLS